MTALPQSTIELLRRVQNERLFIHWRYRVPTPYWTEDDDNNVSNEDWRVLQTLWREEERVITMQTGHPTTRIYRDRVEGGVLVKELIIRRGDKERLAQVLGTEFAVGLEDGILNERHEVENHVEAIRHTVHLSDWLQEAQIENDEYHVLTEWTLTDKARELLTD